MLRYIGIRLFSALLTVFLISVLVFLAISFLGGDSASVLLGREATPEVLSSARQKLGLDRPLYERYFSWVIAFVQGDFGATSASILAGSPTLVRELIAAPLLNSVILATLTFSLTAIVAVWLGQRAGRKPGSRTDRTISSITMALASLPEFVAATLLIFIFFYMLRLLPPVSLVPAGTSPFERPVILVLPVLSLSLGLLAVTARQVRAAVIDVSQLPYVQAARLNGYPEGAVTRSFVMRNSMAPTVQVLALVFIYLFGGVIVIEQVFAYPGIGNLLIRAVTDREVVILQAITMIVAIVSVSLSLVADILVLFLVPKLRTSR
ncbi:ABC transporter permease [Homoserinimonas sp. OAct 916]|uniref:ABC transporter permease n=1 Tax=Homoserinimonas sp. OAct 916 TaxID=2211450 RepID=UPI000DBE48C9|nr:ABC transporter permease [Homoserinimonas sp. OAct 916]